MIRSFIFFVLILSYSCSNDIEAVNALLDKEEIKSETAENISLIYSDSAIVKMKIEAPILKRQIDQYKVTEIFEDGINAEFYGPNGQISGWLDSRYAIRKEKEKQILVRDSVVLWNAKKEKLETSELIWDEDLEILTTNKFVRISQPEKGDTSYGWGFETNADFTRFEIKNKFSSKMSAEELSSALGQNNSDPERTNETQ